MYVYYDFTVVELESRLLDPVKKIKKIVPRSTCENSLDVRKLPNIHKSCFGSLIVRSFYVKSGGYWINFPTPPTIDFYRFFRRKLPMNKIIKHINKALFRLIYVVVP